MDGQEDYADKDAGVDTRTPPRPGSDAKGTSDAGSTVAALPPPTTVRYDFHISESREGTR